MKWIALGLGLILLCLTAAAWGFDFTKWRSGGGTMGGGGETCEGAALTFDGTNCLTFDGTHILTF